MYSRGGSSFFLIDGADFLVPYHMMKTFPFQATKFKYKTTLVAN